MITSYESVLDLIGSVPSAASVDVRDIRWLTDARVIGISRDHNGQVEVFLKGVELKPSSKTIADAIEFREWHRDGAPNFEANRLVLPALGHFDQVAAFICTELHRNGAEAGLRESFWKTEPIVELAIERLRISHETILGLAGELLLLDAMCRGAADDLVAQVVESWDGWKTSARDFSWGSTGIEVKTTTRETSSHLVQGVHQVERNDGVGGGSSEDELYLVSIGLLQRADAGGNSFTIPQLVNRISARMEQTGCGHDVARFLSRVLEYGSGEGYDHRTMSEDPAYSAPFLTRFFRAYDMSDSAVEVLRRDDVTVHHHVDVSSVRFRVDLPTTASSGNPVVGANQVAEVLLAT